MMYIMPFGKHKGEDLRLIDKNYLGWLREKVELRDPLKSSVELVLAGKPL